MLTTACLLLQPASIHLHEALLAAAGGGAKQGAGVAQVLSPLQQLRAVEQPRV